MRESPRHLDDDEARGNAPQTTSGDGKTVPEETKVLARRPAASEAPLATTQTSNPVRAPTPPTPPARKRRVLPEIDGYDIRRLIARGGMGVVYEAIQKKLGRNVAVKLLPTVMSTADPGLVKRFQQEAALVAKLHHNHIIPIYDFGESRDGYYYVMELLEGRPLSAIIKQFASMPFTTSKVMSELLYDPNRPREPVVAASETVTAGPGFVLA